MIFWGPPGSGKTTLARIIAGMTKAQFAPLSAVTAGVADLRRIVEDARRLNAAGGARTILFIDEIHRFNKAQQDVILPHVEEGTVTLIGATTETPSFEVIAPLLSRCRVYTLHQLDEEQIRIIVRRALTDDQQGLGDEGVTIGDEALDHLVSMSNGDARIALNAIELAANATQAEPDGRRHVDLTTVEDALQQRSLIYDRSGDQHYDTISAFIKSLRGSDPDAAVYWLARMIEAGEDPLFIVRRMVILAAEDVGLADPNALVMATACQQAVHFVGMPEGFLPMAETAIYLASAPKSNSAYKAYLSAKEDVKRTGSQPVPLHLRNPVTDLMKQSGYGRDYKYAHDYPGHVIEQQFLPDSLKDKRYYEPGTIGFEKEIAERLKRIRNKDE
jgi:putative ATPase